MEIFARYWSTQQIYFSSEFHFDYCNFSFLFVDVIRISSEIYRKLTSDVMRIEQEDLDIRCLQLLRAVIHNEERKLPEDWEDNPTDNKK